MAAPGRGRKGLTFLVVGILEPFRAEQVFGQNLTPPLDDQRLAAFDDVQLNQLLEAGGAEPANGGQGNTNDPVKVGGPVDEAMEIQIGGDRVELGLRMQRQAQGRHGDGADEGVTQGGGGQA